MSPAPHPRMHGLTHVPGGSDPIPGLDGDEAEPGTYVWVGGHSPQSSGAGAMTTVLCPIAEAPLPAPAGNKHYDPTTTPVGSASAVYTNVGVGVRPLAAGVDITGVQFYRAGVDPATVEIRVFALGGGAPLASDSGDTVPGWNELYFTTPYTMAFGTDYSVGWQPTATAGGRFQATTAHSWPQTIPTLADLIYSHRGLTSGADDYPSATNFNEYFISPILDYVPVPPAKLYVVATAVEGTAAGVHILRTEYDVGVIRIYWSAASVTVAADVHAIAT